MFGYWTGCLQQGFYAFANPVVAVALGVAFAGERLSTNELVGGAMVLAEVVRTRSEWETLMRNDWQLFETTRFGEPRNLAIQISDNGKVGSIVYEVPDISLVEGKSIESLDRFAMTMRKEGDAWRIVQG